MKTHPEKKTKKAPKTHGKFIAVEGIDGSGKTNVIHAAVNFLQSKKIQVFQTRQPGGTPTGENLRKILKNKKPLPKTETLLFAASFHETLQLSILPKLKKGVWVVSDRWTDSTLAYQSAGRGIPEKEIQTILNFAAPTQPHLVLFCNTKPKTAKKRISTRKEKKDRFDSEKNTFQKKVHKYYSKTAKSKTNWKTIPTETLPKDQCRKLTHKILQDFLNQHTKTMKPHTPDTVETKNTQKNP